MKPSKIHVSRHYGDTKKRPAPRPIAQAGATPAAATPAVHGAHAHKRNFEFGLAPFLTAIAFIGAVLMLVLFCAQMALAYATIDPSLLPDVVQFTFHATIIDGDESKTVQTDAITVGQLLEQQQITLGEGDVVFPESYTAVTEGITVEILREFAVYVNVAGERRQIGLAQGTVKDALEKAQVAYDEDDIVTPAIYFPLTPDMEITFDEVNTTEVKETTVIQYKTLYTEDDTLEVGKTKVLTPGVLGEFVQTFAVKMSGDQEIQRVLVDEKLNTSSVDEVIAKGTKPLPKSISVPKERTLKNDSRPDANPPAANQIKKTITMEATAYTHTGNRTATGTKPKVGTVAVNIKQIPYGTKLYVEGYGYAVAEDTGGFRHNGRKRIDLFMDTKSECLQWGRRDVKVHLLK